MGPLPPIKSFIVSKHCYTSTNLSFSNELRYIQLFLIFTPSILNFLLPSIVGHLGQVNLFSVKEQKLTACLGCLSHVTSTGRFCSTKRFSAKLVLGFLGSSLCFYLHLKGQQNIIPLLVSNDLYQHSLQAESVQQEKIIGSLKVKL